MTFDTYRRQHPQLTYQRYHYQYQPATKELTIQFFFELQPGIKFSPTTIIHQVEKSDWQRLSPAWLETLIFNLGLAELPSYWKAACPPVIEIGAGYLTDAQLDWWQQLFRRGLGDFFYHHQINPQDESLLTIKNSLTSPPANQPTSSTTPRAIDSTRPYLIPVGGGKDSSLVLALLRQQSWPLGCLLLEPQSPAAEIIAQASQPQQLIRVTRQIDPELLALNAQGYLNGHTPFSAYLAFLSTLVAHLFGYQQILVANERSANQGNLIYHHQEINHQYSKSFEFETAFRQYSCQYLGSADHQAEYLSVLRPLYELQISQLFSRYPDFWSSFKSCNVGQRQNQWCHHCPKCLFVFAMLYPFMAEEELINQIFKTNLFESADLVEPALELIGAREVKPFECVGTREESQVAFYLAIKKYRQSHRSLPVVLAAASQFLDPIGDEQLALQSQNLLAAWNDDHYLPAPLIKLLKTELKKVSA